MRGPDSTESRHGESRPEHHFSGPWLSLVLRADQPFAPPARFNLREFDEVTFGRGACFGVTRPGDPREHGLLMALGDSLVSRTHARLQRVLGEWVVDDLGSKNGTWVNGDDIQRRRLEDGDVFEIGRSFFLFRQAGRALAGGPDLQPQLPSRPGRVTLHPAWEEELSLLARVAPSTVPVVLRGETGSGKEVAARNLHHLSGRPGRFVAVNCGAIPEDLVESELFGHRRGAFTGATREASGLLRASDHGTLLLDEVGDLPLSSQPALLRALQEREVTPLGGIQPLPVDLRVVCATHQDLDALVSQGRFRVDLLSRICGLTASLPALRDRREDAPPAADPRGAGAPRPAAEAAGRRGGERGRGGPPAPEGPHPGPAVDSPLRDRPGHPAALN